MAIDHIIDYDCVPKQTLTTEGIVERLKGRERAEAIIALFRRNGDNRPPSEMAFEYSRSTPGGEEERRVMLVQSLLDAAEELRPLEHHCAGCPANRAGRPFGCIDFVQYPISAQAESWLIDRLPVPDDTLIWMLLRQGVREFHYDGHTVRPLRQDSDIYFESSQPLSRRLGELEIDSNQVFEMAFSVGNINPNHAALLLLFFHAIERDLEADEIMRIAPAGPDVTVRHPFIIQDEASDDTATRQLKDFLRSLYRAWSLNVRLLVDA